MDKKKAINLAVKAIKDRIQIIAFDANLYEKGIDDYLVGKRRSEEKQQLLEAIQVLEDLK